MNASQVQDQRVWRIIFAAAGLYNIAFGLWAVLWPNAYFQWFNLAAPLYPWIWSCLGMVVGVYGVGYAYVAWKPCHGDVIITLGLLGKVLGPIGWVWTVHQGDIPPRTFPLILVNDLIWWYPFALYLLRRFSSDRTLVTLIVAGVHIIGSVMLLVVAQGTEAAETASARMTFIAHSTSAWTVCWFFWTIASLGLLTFVIMWAQRLREDRAPLALLIVGCVVCAAGLVFDLTSEVIAIAVLTDRSLDVDAFVGAARMMALLGAGAGNALYCVGGFILSVVAWRGGFQRGWLAVLGFSVWSCGLLLSIATFTDFHAMMIVCGGGLMILFIPWMIWTGLQLRRPA